MVYVKGGTQARASRDRKELAGGGTGAEAGGRAPWQCHEEAATPNSLAARVDVQNEAFPRACRVRVALKVTKEEQQHAREC